LFALRGKAEHTSFPLLEELKSPAYVIGRLQNGNSPGIVVRKNRPHAREAEVLKDRQTAASGGQGIKGNNW